MIKQHSRSIGPYGCSYTTTSRRYDHVMAVFDLVKWNETVWVLMVQPILLQERLYTVSDKYEVFACRKCGMFVIFNNAQHLHLCKTCGNRVSFALIKIPYACKLLFQELTTMNIAPRIITDKA